MTEEEYYRLYGDPRGGDPIIEPTAPYEGDVPWVPPSPGGGGYTYVPPKPPAPPAPPTPPPTKPPTWAPAQTGSAYVPRKTGLRTQYATRNLPPTYGQISSSPTWFKQYQPKDASGNKVLYNVVNNMLKYLDPGTQWQMGQWLAQQDPATFGSYAKVAQPNIAITTPPYTDAQAAFNPAAGWANQVTENLNQPSPYLNPLRLIDAMSNLDPTKIASSVFSGTPNATQTAAINAQMKPFNWLKEYLSTAAQAMPGQGTASVGGGEGFRRPPRSVQQASLAHIKTLENQVLNDSSLAPVLTLAQNLVNPQTRTMSPSGAGSVGSSRALSKPFGTYTRGGIGRNLWLT